MYRLSDKNIKEMPDLQRLATLCLTETIKCNLEKFFFEEDYDNVSPNELYTKVKTKKIIEILLADILKEMEDCDVNVNTFLSKKMAQFMNILNDKKPITPDIFIEYILYKTTVYVDHNDFEEIPDCIEDYKYELKDLLRIYGEKVIEFEDEEAIEDFVVESVQSLTSFTCLQGGYYNGFTFWDYDFKLFDNYGFKKTLHEFAVGALMYSGYSLSYIYSIFTSVNEDVPVFLKKNLK